MLNDLHLNSDLNLKGLIVHVVQNYPYERFSALMTTTQQYVMYVKDLSVCQDKMDDDGFILNWKCDILR